MIFKGEPNLFVRISNKMFQRATGKKGFYFDENGRYETDNELMIKILKQHFPVEEEEIKKYHCKKCDYETENKGELLAHYRQSHKEE